MRKAYILLSVVFLGVGIANAQPGDNDPDGQKKGQVDKKQLLKLVNDARAKGCSCGGKYFAPATPVVWNDKLEIAAMAHTRFMKTNNNLSHAGENGTNAGQRITVAGYKWTAYGENIAVGYASEDDVVKGWLKSPSHCKNIMNGNFRDMAVTRDGGYWTQLLAIGQ